MRCQASESMNAPAHCSLFQSADILQPIPDNILRLTDQVIVQSQRLSLPEHEVFYLLTEPPRNNFAKGNVLLVHGQSYSSAVWLENSTMQIFAAAGYRCVAIDLPGCGRTTGPAVSDAEKSNVLSLIIRRLQLESVMIIGHSMAGQYIIPMLDTDLAACIVGVALSNTNTLPNDVSTIKTPVLIVWGEHDTSLGMNAANNLKRVPNSRLLKIPSGSHACFLNEPKLFQSACLNFFDLVRHYSFS
ncbi:hypothetical protein AB6A40_006098 [Gnathostoma spinigerum]|uniref:AB hydrolase-1 domain-containing protein n=1 Tax=Gnathostoma spinigerum TaxID=75299 RepID=A0ABD6EML2_9BILA